jgi:hypothetical protein
MALVSHMITYDAIVRRWMILLLLRTRVCHVLLVTETLLGA